MILVADMMILEIDFSGLGASAAFLWEATCHVEAASTKQHLVVENSRQRVKPGRMRSHTESEKSGSGTLRQ